ncbi:MAG: TetR/AcrR family transcriptional regulator [Actinomycetota bacterium]|nr:TetR/AcrR family transcriptional regulator [Actinomycetota bacterium]MDQ2957419.1 TetR/AcrR family transcriptional regulator [Actinomycetota bacterium]
MSTQGPSPRPDPLIDILLCPTTGRPVPGSSPAWSAAPLSARTTVGTRSRAAILDGARRAVTANGTKITMAQVAARAGVAKATLYNHFRAREDVLAELLLAEIDELISAVSHLRLADALTQAAVAVSEHPLLEALGGQDSTALAVLARVDVRSAGWARVAQATELLLSRHGRRGTPTVLRWLSSFVIAPAEDRDIAADVAVLMAGLPPAR